MWTKALAVLLASVSVFCAVNVAAEFLAHSFRGELFELQRSKKSFLHFAILLLKRLHPRWLEPRIRLQVEKVFKARGLNSVADAYETFLTGELLALTVGVFSGLLFASPTAGFTLAAVAFFIPFADAAAKKKQLEMEVYRAFPFFLDILSILLEAGIDFSIACQRTARVLPQGKVKEGVEEIVKAMKLGATRREAANRLKEVLPVREVEEFVSSLDQAFNAGVSLLPIVKDFAHLMRRKRFEMAEARAGQIPVKLMMPLLLIFICNFIVIVTPILIKSLSGGFVP